jgi:hypothetical protein
MHFRGGGDVSRYRQWGFREVGRAGHVFDLVMGL